MAAKRRAKSVRNKRVLSAAREMSLRIRDLRSNGGVVDERIAASLIDLCTDEDVRTALVETREEMRISSVAVIDHFLTMVARALLR